MNFIISPAPHIKGHFQVPKVMRIVFLALVPAALAGIYFFGLQALGLILVCVITAILSELVMNKIMKKDTIADGSAALTGLLVALTVTPALPYYMAVLGTIFAIVVGKQLFGGLGFNVFNPALVGRAFLAAAFPVQMTTSLAPFFYRGVDAVTKATPLAAMKFEQTLTPYWDLLLGNVGGCLGETSALALLIPALLLTFIGIINWRIPFSYLGTVALLGGVFWLINPTYYPDPIFHLLAGGLMIGGLYMMTDYVTSPLTNKGKWFFGVGGGVLVVIIRLFSGLPEGVMFSILIMNALVPLINRYTRPRILGRKK